MLAVGAIAPEIRAESTKGTFTLSASGGRLCTVVYFFPKAFTPGCTYETKRFRADYNELALVGAEVVGISIDDLATQCSFAESLRADFPLVADTDGAISTAYDVKWPVVGVAQRVTYVVGHDRTILAAFHHEVLVDRHRDDVLAFVDALYQERIGTRAE